jgi:hypothetical protein
MVGKASTSVQDHTSTSVQGRIAGSIVKAPYQGMQGINTFLKGSQSIKVLGKDTTITSVPYNLSGSFDARFQGKTHAIVPARFASSYVSSRFRVDKMGKMPESYDSGD